ncbi:MAG: hypothetical protein KJN92_11950, partial [Gemmatimonadetes bacterium]|nr:hypothetical protein [Gemmatimonadota bacterium]
MTLRPTSMMSIALLLMIGGCQGPPDSSLDLQWAGLPDRRWPGPDIWANRIQDWSIRDGRLEATSDLPMRTAHILTRLLAPTRGPILAVLDLGLSTDQDDASGPAADQDDSSAGGILLGAGGGGLDYRRAALIHHSPGPGGGLFVGIDDRGHLAVRDFEDGNRVLFSSDDALPCSRSCQLRIRIEEDGPEGRGDVNDRERGGPDRFTLTVEARDPTGDEPPISLQVPGLPSERMAGGVALVSHGGGAGTAKTWFSRVRLEGPGWESRDDRALGPILGAQHTLSRGMLTLTAQLFAISPLHPGPASPSPDSVVMELQDEAGAWARVGSAPVLTPAFTATLGVSEWSGDRDVPYRLTLPGTTVGSTDGRNLDLAYRGEIRAEPLEKDDVIVAAFTGNHNVASPGVDGGAFAWETDIWFPHEDILAHVQAQDPDFLFFSGDQVYEGASPTRADFDNPYEDYLYKWYLWLWAFRDLTRDIPSVAIPDDHDVFHGNVWGAGGRATPPGLAGAAAQDQGGYKLPTDWVNMVQRTQASHLPTPWRTTPLDGGIETYYTDILYGGLSFAVLEDRKFKSPPKLLVPEADVWNGWAQNAEFDPTTGADPPGASLLGAEQEA